MKRVGIRSQGDLNSVTRTGNLPCQAMLLIGPLWQKDWVRDTINWSVMLLNALSLFLLSRKSHWILHIGGKK